MPPVKALIDLNVILDVLLARQPFYAASAGVWAAAETRRVTGLLAAHSLSTLFYLYAKQNSAAEATTRLRQLLTVFSVAPIDQIVVTRALGWGWNDFEDALQLAAAEVSRADYLITRDRQGFKNADSPVVVLSPAEFTALINAQTNT